MWLIIINKNKNVIRFKKKKQQHLNEFHVWSGAECYTKLGKIKVKNTFMHMD